MPCIAEYSVPSSSLTLLVIREKVAEGILTSVRTFWHAERLAVCVCVRASMRVYTLARIDVTKVASTCRRVCVCVRV